MRYVISRPTIYFNNNISIKEQSINKVNRVILVCRINIKSF